jgi:hypothetical protein
MIELSLDLATQHTDPDFKRKLREAKLACKEAAGWQCEWMYPNKTRCGARQNQLRKKKGKGSEPEGWSVMKLHGCHIDQNDPLNPNPRLICLCPKHHMEFDRCTELAEEIRQYRRGYQLTSTDSLIAAMQHTGIAIWEEADGYHWQIDGIPQRGKRTTAVGAVGAAIAHMYGLLTTTQRDLEMARREIAELQLVATQKELEAARQEIMQLRQALKHQPGQLDTKALFTYLIS